MKKKEALQHWDRLEEGQNPLDHMTPIPYKQSGSKYGTCGIRIDGNPQFVDAVLSNLKDLLGGENNSTRLELGRRKVKPTEVKGETKSFDNREDDAEVCYIRLHKRGKESQQMNTLFDVFGKRK